MNMSLAVEASGKSAEMPLVQLKAPQLNRLVAGLRI